MAEITIRVGAAMDRSVTDVFRQVTELAKKARVAVEGQTATAASSTIAKVGKEQAEAAKRVTKTVQTEADKQADAQAKAAKKAADARVREAAKAEKELDRIRRRENEEILRDVKKIEREEARAAKAKAAAQTKADRENALFAPRRVRNGWMPSPGEVARSLAFYGARRLAGGMYNVASETAKGMGLETNFGTMVGKTTALESTVNQLVNSGYMSGAAGPNGKLQSAAEITKQVRGISNYAAMDAGAVAGGLEKFVSRTGDLAMGRDIMKDMAHLSKATGSSMEDMMNAAASVANQLENTPDKAKQLYDIMRGVAGAGKLGAVEVKDFASQMQKIAALASKFSGDKSTTIAKLVGLAEGAVQGGGALGAADAATSLVRLGTQMTAGARDAKFHQYTGKSFFMDPGKGAGKNTKLREIDEVILDAIGGTKGNLTQMREIFQSSVAEKSYANVARVYRETGGTHEEKLAAAKREMDRLAGATLSAAEETRAFATRMAETQSKMQLINNKYEEAAGQFKEALSPVIMALSGPVLAGLQALGSVLGTLLGTKEEKRQQEGASADIEAFNAQQQLAAEMKTGKVQQATLDRAEKAKTRVRAALATAGEKAAGEMQTPIWGMESMGADVAEPDAQTAKSIQMYAKSTADLEKLGAQVADALAKKTLTVVVTKQPDPPPTPPSVKDDNRRRRIGK